MSRERVNICTACLKQFPAGPYLQRRTRRHLRDAGHGQEAMVIGCFAHDLIVGMTDALRYAQGEIALPTRWFSTGELSQPEREFRVRVTIDPDEKEEEG